MKNEPWIVKTRSGATWGKICKVVIDSATRQIVCVDVMLGDTSHFVRVPWRSLAIENEDIVLNISEGDVHTTVGLSGARLPDTVTLEESAAAFHI